MAWFQGSINVTFCGGSPLVLSKYTTFSLVHLSHSFIIQLLHTPPNSNHSQTKFKSFLLTNYFMSTLAFKVPFPQINCIY